jgi:uncharacterized membrane protein
MILQQTLTVNQFGNFTAYFRAVPPAIPSEYWIPLYGIIVSTVVESSIPSIISWRKSKNQTAILIMIRSLKGIEKGFLERQLQPIIAPISIVFLIPATYNINNITHFATA